MSRRIAFSFGFTFFLLHGAQVAWAEEPTIRVAVTGENQAYGGRLERGLDSAGQSRLVLELPLETYLAGVVRYEVDPSWTDPLLKTQAVLARTYAYRKMLDRAGEFYHVQSTTEDQVFGDPHTAPPQVTKAIEKTRGEMILYEGQPIHAFYHSTCGGHTEDAAAVFWPLPYAIGIPDQYCMESPRSFWKLQLSVEEIADRLAAGDVEVGRPIALEVLDRDPSDRVGTLIVRGPEGFQMLSGKDFRRMIGYTQLRSAHFELRTDGDGQVKFLGTGSGHGVGLCQWGAKVMAEKGFGYKEIIGYYYKGVEVKRVY